MKLVKESISFQKIREPKKVLGLGVDEYNKEIAQNFYSSEFDHSWIAGNYMDVREIIGEMLNDRFSESKNLHDAIILVVNRKGIKHQIEWLKKLIELTAIMQKLGMILDEELSSLLKDREVIDKIKIRYD